MRTAVALVAVALLPWVADRMRGASYRCAMDGVAIDPAFEVTVVEADGSKSSFCGVRCARSWLARRGGAAKEVLVTDCESGRTLPAGEAWFVLSLGSWRGGTPDAIRVFEKRDAAVRYLENYGGRLMQQDERPFGKRRKDRATGE